MNQKHRVPIIGLRTIMLGLLKPFPSLNSRLIKDNNIVNVVSIASNDLSEGRVFKFAY